MFCRRFSKGTIVQMDQVSHEFSENSRRGYLEILEKFELEKVEIITFLVNYIQNWEKNEHFQRK